MLATMHFVCMTCAKKVFIDYSLHIRPYVEQCFQLLHDAIVTHKMPMCYSTCQRLRPLYCPATEATFADDGLASCNDNVAFEAVYTRVRDTLLPKLPDVMQQYYIAKIEPVLRNNMEAMWHVRRLD